MTHWHDTMVDKPEEKEKRWKKNKTCRSTKIKKWINEKKKKKRTMVGAQGIEPWTSPV